MSLSRLFLLTILFSVFARVLYAQEPSDSTLIKELDYSERFNPRRALFYSAILPGMGQAYNKKYWKIPIFYAGFAVGIYVTGFYQEQYVDYRNELLNSISTNSFPSTPSNFTEATLRRAVDFYQRKRDATIVFLGIGYLLQIVDAHVDAHLKDFKYNPNLKVSLEPVIRQDVFTGTTSGLGLTFTF